MDILIPDFVKRRINMISLFEAFWNLCFTMEHLTSGVDLSRRAFDMYSDYRLPEIDFCVAPKSKSKQHTRFAVIYGRKKDRGGLKDKYKRYLENEGKTAKILKEVLYG